MIEVETLAKALIAARRDGPPVDAAAGQDLTHQQAYAVQERVARALGPVGGFKYARRPGMQAIMAPIQAGDILASGAGFAAGGAPVGVELEIGFRIDAPLPDPQSADFPERLRACVTPVAAIELVQTRLAEHGAAPAILRLADHQLNGGLVVGEAAPDWRGAPYAEATARLRFDEETVLDGAVRLPFGPAFDCLVDLARRVGAHCGGLRSGQVVITGSLNGLPWLPPGKRVAGEIDGIGAVAVDLD